MRKAVVGLAVVASLAAGAAVALAHTHTYGTTIEPPSWGFSSSPVFKFEANGALDSSNAKCLRRRAVELHFGFPSGRTKLIDVDSSSHSGAFAVGGTTGSRPTSFTIKVLRERIDRSLGTAHHHICRGVELTTPIPAQQ